MIMSGGKGQVKVVRGGEGRDTKKVWNEKEEREDRKVRGGKRKRERN